MRQNQRANLSRALERQFLRALGRFFPAGPNLSRALERQNQGDDMAADIIYAHAVMKWIGALDTLPTQI